VESKTQMTSKTENNLACASGSCISSTSSLLVYQSPIALSDGESVYYSKDDLKVPKIAITDYKYDTTKKIWNISGGVGFTPPSSSSLDKEYVLQQFHFHEKGEHTVNDKEYDMEWHNVFTNANGDHFVIGYLLHQSHKSSKVIRDLLKGKPLKLHNPCSYWSYPGSLTTAPFTVGVNWIISDCTISITSKDLQLLRSWSQHQRKLQKRGGRDVVHVDNLPK